MHLSCLLCVGTAFCPVWMVTLGQWIAVQDYGPSYVLRFPILILDFFFVVFFLPSVITFLISRNCRYGRRFITIAIRPVAFLGTIIAFVIIILSNGEWFFPLVTSWTYVAAPCSFSLIGYAIGFFIALVIGRMPADKAATFSAQSGVANIVVSIAMSSSMLPEPDNSVAYVPAFMFGVSSLIIGYLLVPLVAVSRWLVNRYWPETFQLSSTDQRLQDEERQRVRQAQKLKRTISLISDFHFKGSISVADEKHETVSDAPDWNADEERSNKSADDESDYGKRATFEIAKW
jgi:hypothetical protein